MKVEHRGRKATCDSGCKHPQTVLYSDFKRREGSRLLRKGYHTLRLLVIEADIWAYCKISNLHRTT